MSSECVGRVAVIIGALPEIVPVHFTLGEETVVIGVHRGSELAEIEEGTVVALQVDRFDTERESGWHVRAFGTCRWTTDPLDLAIAGGLAPRPWTTGGESDRLLEIDLTFVSGYEVGFTNRGRKEHHDRPAPRP
jgi:uncharacterized protein